MNEMEASIWKTLASAIALTYILVNAPCASGQTQTRPIVPKATAADLSSSLEATSGRVGRSVVEIFTTSYVTHQGVVPNMADLVATQRGSGSGVIVDPDGYIVTNAHVVEGAQRLRVELPIPTAGHSILTTSSRTVSGRIVGLDRETDLAVIKVDERGLPPSHSETPTN
jgi:serine protease Do